VADAISEVDVPQPDEAVAVGGSAASLRRIAGPVLNAESFHHTLALLGSEPSHDLAARLSLDIQRVRLLPAGLLILQAASELFRSSLQIARGGVREGVLLEASA
jgi:exopolyphosphatase/guanosine-5'-triphosphate,3'-diphosphate pyrophosphatase